MTWISSLQSCNTFILFFSNAMLAESILWSYAIQLTGALRVIHAAGLSCRCLDPSKVIITNRNRVRLSGVCVFDVILYDHSPANRLQLTSHFQVMIWFLISLWCLHTILFFVFHISGIKVLVKYGKGGKIVCLIHFIFLKLIFFFLKNVTKSFIKVMYKYELVWRHSNIFNFYLQIYYNQIWKFQQEDLSELGKLLLALACGSLIAIQKENLQTSLEVMSRTYSTDIRNLIA